MSVSRIGYVELMVPDPERSVAWATDLLGLREVDTVDGRIYLTCNERHHELVLVEGPAPALVCVALEARTPADLDLLVSRLNDAGTACHDVEVAGVDRATELTAPGGIRFQLFSGMAADEPRVFNSIGTTPRKFGHATLVSDVAQDLEDLLCGPLGFRVSDRVPGVISWFRCSPDHHAVAIVPGAGNGLHHYAFELEGWSTVEAFADHLVNNGTRLIWGPGRHGPGRNIFTYHLDPMGAVVEVFTDLQRIDNDHDYAPVSWIDDPVTLNQWGPPPPADFLDHLVPALDSSGA